MAVDRLLFGRAIVILETMVESCEGLGVSRDAMLAALGEVFARFAARMPEAERGDYVAGWVRAVQTRTIEHAAADGAGHALTPEQLHERIRRHARN